MKLIQFSHFGVEVMFFQQLYPKKNQNKTHSEEGIYESLYFLAIIPPRIYATIFGIEILQCNFTKMRGEGGRKPF